MCEPSTFAPSRFEIYVMNKEENRKITISRKIILSRTAAARTQSVEPARSAGFRPLITAPPPTYRPAAKSSSGAAEGKNDTRGVNPGAQGSEQRLFKSYM